MKLIVAIAVILLFYRIGIIRTNIFKMGLNKEYDKYEYLFKNTTESENYKIIRIADKRPEHILFDRITGNFILSGDELYKTTIQKINKNGELIDSLEIEGHLYPSGMYFYEDYCIDWAITGNKSKQKYDTIINYDSLSKKEFEDYLNKAEIVDFTHFRESEKSEHTGRCYYLKGRCHLKIQDKWIVIESKKLFEELENDYEKEYFELKHKIFSKKNGDRLIALSNSIAPFHNWEKQDNMIFIQKFSKESYTRRSLGDFNSHGSGTGWHGTGYFQLTYKSEILNFKSYTFQASTWRFSTPKISSCKPYISIYYPEKSYNIALVFIELSKPPGVLRNSEEIGLYVLKKKN